MNQPDPIIAIHGGAGAIARSEMTAEQERDYLEALHDIVCAGQKLLAEGTSALDTVTETVRQFEDCPLFNAGKGAVFTAAGTAGSRRRGLRAAVAESGAGGAGGDGAQRSRTADG
jgi:beta-aspartyl-peptidase (threonine type)